MASYDQEQNTFLGCVICFADRDRPKTESRTGWLCSQLWLFPKFLKTLPTQRRSPLYSWAGLDVFTNNYMLSFWYCLTGNRHSCFMFFAWPSHSSLSSSARLSTDKRLAFTLFMCYCRDQDLCRKLCQFCGGCAEPRLPRDCIKIWSHFQQFKVIDFKIDIYETETCV